MDEVLTPRQRAVGDAIRAELPGTVQLISLTEENDQIVAADFKFTSEADMSNLPTVVSDALDSAFRNVDVAYANEATVKVKINRA